MAWTTMHFAAGMIGTGAAVGALCLITRRGWRWLPPAMTVGGLWGLVPDLPRIFREDLTSLPMSGLLGSKSLEAKLHEWGNLFFLHGALDRQPRELALHGLILILLLYNASVMLLMWLERRARRDPVARAAAFHQEALRHTARDQSRHRSRGHKPSRRHTGRRDHHPHAHATNLHLAHALRRDAQVMDESEWTSTLTTDPSHDAPPVEALPVYQSDNPVLHRIGPAA